MEQLRDHRSFYFVQEQILSFIIVIYVKGNYPRPSRPHPTSSGRDAIVTAQSDTRWYQDKIIQIARTGTKSGIRSMGLKA
jgi:hypothetical protein